MHVRRGSQEQTKRLRWSRLEHVDAGDRDQRPGAKTGRVGVRQSVVLGLEHAVADPEEQRSPSRRSELRQQQGIVYPDQLGVVIAGQQILLCHRPRRRHGRLRQPAG